jgi:hypothetical protein
VKRPTFLLWAAWLASSPTWAQSEQQRTDAGTELRRAGEHFGNAVRELADEVKPALKKAGRKLDEAGESLKSELRNDKPKRGSSQSEKPRATRQNKRSLPSQQAPSPSQAADGGR